MTTQPSPAPIPATRTALRLAERATLGALLLDPDLPAQVAGWLRAEDFDDPWHRHVYAAVRELHLAHRAPDAATVATALVHRHGYRVADQPRILDVLHAVPIRPRPTHYAAIVLEASLRRQVAGHGVLLEAAALAAALDSRPAVLNAVTAQVDATVEQAQTRWAIATRTTGTTRVPLPAPPDGRAVLPSALGADRLLSRHPIPDPDSVQRREADLIAALVARPEHLPAVEAWLPPDAVTSPTWRPVYTALVDLHATGTPIDVVTTAWHTARNENHAGTGPELRALDELVTYAAALDPVHAATLVAADQLRLTAHRTADALRADAANSGLDVRDLLDTTLLHTRALRSAALHLDPRAPTPDGEGLAAEQRPPRRTTGRHHFAVVTR